MCVTVTSTRAEVDSIEIPATIEGREQQADQLVNLGLISRLKSG